jgi:hypothetical protein
MSSRRTYRRQRERLRRLGVRTIELPALRDVDTFEDADAVANAAPTTAFAAELARVRASWRRAAVPTMAAAGGRR